MKKIAFLVPSIQSCGPVNVVRSIIVELYKTHQIYLISIRKEDSNEGFIEILQPYLTCPPFFLSDERSYSFFQLSKKLNQVLSDNKITAIHAHGLIPTIIVGLSKLKNIKKLTTLHCIPHKDFIPEYGRLKGYLLSVMQYTALNLLYFDSIISCSKSVEKGFIGRSLGRNRNRLQVIHNGVDNKVYYPLPQSDKRKEKNKLNIYDDIIYVYCGRLCRRKQVPELIHLFKSSVKNEKARLYILGDGEEKEICLKEANNDPRITFLGFIDTPSKYYQISDYIISMSSAEGYPLSIIEAMLCGCGAFLSKIDAHEEIINLYPNTAFDIQELSDSFFKPQTHESLESLQSSHMAQKYERLY